MTSGYRIQDSGRGLSIITLKALHHVPSNGQGSVWGWYRHRTLKHTHKLQPIDSSSSLSSDSQIMEKGSEDSLW